MGRNQPPETIAFLPENPDTSRYVQALSWWGEDVDGEVTHYFFRFLCDPGEWCRADSAWVMTTATESTFYLPVSDGLAAHTFEVKAVDDDGAEDPTPARINLLLRNSRPEVSIKNRSNLPDTTLPAVTFEWTGRDTVDGNDTIVQYLVWLDGQETPHVVDRLVTRYTFGQEDLLTGIDGPRTLYIKAVDSGSDTSEAATYTWYVKQPAGRILVVDDVPSMLVGALQSDAFFRGLVDSLASAGEPATILDFDRHGRFLHQEDVFPSLGLFDAVLWYTGRDSMGSDNLDFAESGIREYLDNGGAFCLSSMGALGTRGVLSEEFAVDYLGAGEVFIDAWSSDTNFEISRGDTILAVAGTGLGTLTASKTQIWVENFAPVEGATALYRMPPGRYSGQGDSWSVAVRNESDGGGRVVYCSFAFELCDGLGNARAELARIMAGLLP